MGSISLASIEAHLALLPSPKKEELCAPYELISEEMKSEPISFFDGKNENGKTIANPTIGFGETILQYTNGKKGKYSELEFVQLHQDFPSIS
jgi:hypothetical protein